MTTVSQRVLKRLRRRITKRSSLPNEIFSAFAGTIVGPIAYRARTTSGRFGRGFSACVDVGVTVGADAEDSVIETLRPLKCLRVFRLVLFADASINSRI